MRHMRIVVAVVVAAALLAPTAASAAGGATYTVQPGDSLWSIAHHATVGLDALLAANDLELTSTIHPGQTLTIPNGSAGSQDPSGSGGAGGRTETVRPGDSLWAIARRIGTTLAALLDANGMSERTVIHPRQSVVVPDGSTGPSATATSTATSTASSGASATTYVVRSGDGLYSIAHRAGVAVRALLDANSLTLASVVHPGQRLTIPTSSLPREVAASEDLVPIFRRSAAEAGVPADLLMAVAYVESRWNQSARSASGAVGVGQLMPGTAAWVARDLMGEPDLDISDTDDNVRISAHLLGWLLDEAGGDADRALAMYLQGVHGVRVNGVSTASVQYAGRIAGVRRSFS